MSYGGFEQSQFFQELGSRFHKNLIGNNSSETQKTQKSHLGKTKTHVWTSLSNSCFS